MVVGHWPASPFGSFADVMVERSDGHRLLLAPSDDVAGFVAAMYRFDEVRITPVAIRRSSDRWEVAAGPLELDLTLGSRTWLGRLLRLVFDILLDCRRRFLHALGRRDGLCLFDGVGFSDGV